MAGDMDDDDDRFAYEPSARPAFCPSCGKERVSHFHAGQFIEPDGWASVGGDIWLCPDCATEEQHRLALGLCPRCGRTQGDENWLGGGTVCPGCSTAAEKHTFALEAIRGCATTLCFLLVGRYEGVSPVSAVGRAEYAMGLALKDAAGAAQDVPPRLVPGELATELARCAAGIDHRDRQTDPSDEEIPAPDWALVERVARVFIHYLRDVG